ncbi:hypothetical protein AN958_08580 [Leucoagaricus sp. SymC.cos]|nr:hypothetical protein AN958_08580 [Leucoagaricus sp. SymC.cos]
MPALVSSPSPTRPTSPSTAPKSRPGTKKAKSRAVRRRGRASGGIESDDEIERVYSSESGSDSDDSLSPDSATDSEQELASEDEHPDRHIDAHTPNTSHDSGALDKDTAVHEKSADTFFSTSGNWSEMVADENMNGAADLPVIEFSEFKADAVPIPQLPHRKARKAGKKKTPLPERDAEPSSVPRPPTSQSVNGNDELVSNKAHPEDKVSSHRQSSQPKRPVGQSARQAYQEKLESDPSFVPKVGGFWGHDDRLMDKDLRSLSGWWRGRWQGRSRGRGGFVAGNGRRGSHVDEDNKEDIANLPPIERPWTHDGFEEMKRKEEQRSEFLSQRQANMGVHGAARGRGGVPTIRGGRGGLPRGGFVNSGNRSSAAAKAGRIWYTMKPEHMWTKQSEKFLFFEPKHRASGPAYRIHLPGSRSQLIKPPPSPTYPLVTSNNVTTGTASVMGSDLGDESVIIKLPKHEEEEASTSVDETPLEDVFKVRPRLVSVDPIPLPAPSNTKSSSPADRPTHRSLPSPVTNPDPAVRSQLEQLTPTALSMDPNRYAQTEKAVLRNPGTEPPADEPTKSPLPDSTSRRPSLPPIQTVYSPPPAQPSSAYPSSYGYPALPPGITLNQHGVSYEVATGHPVFIPAAAPLPMYNPRPVMHSHVPQQSISYMSPPHMYPSSTMSPDFVAHQPPSHSHTPSGGMPVNGFIDPATGVPMFSLPRPSRVEIRAPGETASKPSLNNSVKPSSVTPQASLGASQLPATSAGYASAPVEASANAISQPMVHYPAYQQYYYPDPAYGYPQYVDVSQVSQYEMYAPPMEAHGTTYY